MSLHSQGPIEVLLVEDDVADRLIIEEVLTQASGVRLHAVSDGLQALSFLHRRDGFAQAPRPHLVLLDLNLPGVSGYEVLRHLKLTAELKDIPVVVLSTLSSDEEVKEIYQRMANAVVNKPLELEAFEAVLGSIRRFWCDGASLPRDDIPEAPSTFSVEPQAKSLRLLLIEDEPSDALIAKSALGGISERRIDITHVTRLSEALEVLSRAKYDVIVADLALPDSRGVDTVRALAAATLSPIIILTVLDDGEVGAEAMRSGAKDYIHKDELSNRSLYRAIRYCLSRQEAEARVREIQRMDSVGRLAGGIAHDFNNLLAIVTNNAELIEVCEDRQECIEATRDILEASKRGATLVKQLLGYSSRQPMLPTPLDSAGVVRNLRPMIESLAPEGVEVVFRLDGSDGARIRADPGLIEEAVVNLVVNSLDAMPHGGWLLLDCQTLRGSDAGLTSSDCGDFVRLRVQDGGEGIAQEHLDKIFDPFFTTKQIGRGTGLGLAAVQGIVHQHGGFVRVKSEVGVGSTFDLYFPIHRSAVG